MPKDAGVQPELAQEIPDDEAVARVRAGETHVYEVLMRRYNRRVYRIARSILRDDAEAEDVMQDAYVRAYQHLDEFAGTAKFSTWLTRIAVYEALRRVARRSKTTELETVMETAKTDLASPETNAYTDEIRAVLESAIDSLPEGYRTVVVLRLIEGLDVAETSAALDIGEEAVKTRLHRARIKLQKDLHRRIGHAASHAFPFHLSRCDRVVAAVLSRL